MGLTFLLFVDLFSTVVVILMISCPIYYTFEVIPLHWHPLLIWTFEILVPNEFLPSVNFIFTAQCTIVQSTVLQSHVVCPSVCDVGGSGPHRLKILETNCTNNYRNIFALRSPKVICLLPGEHGEILGRLEVGWKKVACWSTKAEISLRHVKIEEKLLWRAYRKSSKLFRMVLSSVPRPPTTSFSPRLGFTTPNQNSNRYYRRNS